MIITGLLLGLALGFVFQRGRFCVTGAFRDVWLSGSRRWFTAFLVAIATQAVAVNAMISAGWINPNIPTLALVAVVGGSFMFGVGIVLAGGCATGTYYRSGEGLIGSWIALIFYTLSAAVMKSGLGAEFTASQRNETQNATTFYDTLGISIWVLVLLLALLVGYLLVQQVRKTKAPLTMLPPKRTGFAHLLFEKKWTPNTTAVIVGILAAIAYPLSQATGRNSGLSITTPSANIVEFFATGDTTLIDWGVMLVLGIIPGSYIAAKFSGEFRFRAPDAPTSIRAIAGGTLMGTGAAVAGGCSIGNSLVQTALFSWQGWTALLFTFLGVGFAAKSFVQTHRRAGAVVSEVPQVAEVR